MQVDLVRTQTADGLRLDGAVHEAEPEKRHAELDAIACFSGVGSNFYGSRMLDHIAQRMNDIGISALCANTRGHDGISTAATRFGAKPQGAAYEVVDACRYDVAAWVNFLLERGYQRIGLLGHSLGAIKVLYSQAYEAHHSVQSIIAISPPRLSCSRFKNSSRADSFCSSLARAQAMVDNEQAKDLFSASFPFPLIISAETYVDKYGPQERYNILRFAHRIRSRLAFIYGGAELSDGNPAFVELESELEKLAWQRRPAIRVVNGADHFYSGRIAQLWDEIAGAISMSSEH